MTYSRQEGGGRGVNRACQVRVPERVMRLRRHARKRARCGRSRHAGFSVWGRVLAVWCAGLRTDFGCKVMSDAFCFLPLRAFATALCVASAQGSSSRVR